MGRLGHALAENWLAELVALDEGLAIEHTFLHFAEVVSDKDLVKTVGGFVIFNSLLHP